MSLRNIERRKNFKKRELCNTLQCDFYYPYLDEPNGEMIIESSTESVNDKSSSIVSEFVREISHQSPTSTPVPHEPQITSPVPHESPTSTPVLHESEMTSSVSHESETTVTVFHEPTPEKEKTPIKHFICPRNACRNRCNYSYSITI